MIEQYCWEGTGKFSIGSHIKIVIEGIGVHKEGRRHDEFNTILRVICDFTLSRVFVMRNISSMV